jgi:1-acyl-sn-glycerol-3-phosphate acyltransferase
MKGPATWRHESFARAWLRRSATIPIYLTVAALLILLSPVLLIFVGVTDLLRRRGFVLVRCLMLAIVFFIAEVAGMLASLGLWLRHAGWLREPSSAYLAANFALQRRWASAIFAGMRWTFGLRVSVEGDAALRPGPVIVLGRHASPLDNLIPAVIASGRHHLRLRWVINRWLLRDPCLDIVGNRLPNVFVATGSEEARGQAARVGALAAGLGPDDGVLIFPEGALFSPARLRRAVARLTESGAEDAGRAAALRSVLPPRSGAFLSALAAAPDADVVIFQHKGLETAGNYRSLATGKLIGAELVIRVRRIARSDIPKDSRGQTGWLWDQWSELDRWVRGVPASSRGDPCP